MSAMQLAKYSGAQISIGGRSYTKTGTGPVVFIPAYKNTGGTVWHYWAVLGRSESAAAGTVNTPQYTAAYNLTVNGRPVYVLTLDNGAFETETLTISGMGMTYTEIPTGAEGQWYDLGSMTGENYWLKEAESMLYAYETRPRPGLMMPGGGNGKAPIALYTYNNRTEESEMHWTFTVPKETKAKSLIVVATGTAIKNFTVPTVSSGTVTQTDITYWERNQGVWSETLMAYAWCINGFQLPLTVTVNATPWHWGYSAFAFVCK